MKRRIFILCVTAVLAVLAALLPRMLLHPVGSAVAVIRRPGISVRPLVGPAYLPAPICTADGAISPDFLARHRANLQFGREHQIDLLFLGDSITYLWIHAPEIWNRSFGAWHPANFGIGSTGTQQLLWEIDNGALDAIHPRVVVVLVGTNNLNDPEQDIVLAIEKIIGQIHAKLPASQVLLLGILPRDIMPDGPYRAKIVSINKTLARFDDASATRFLDLGSAFISPDGKMRLDSTTDGLHLSKTGYQLWADAMQPLIDAMMK